MTDPIKTNPPFVLEDSSGAVLWLTLNRPEQRNPLSRDMIQTLYQAIERANVSSDVRVIVLTGAGPVFSAGHDMTEMGAWSGDNAKSREAHLREVLSDCAEMMMSIQHSPKAVIACVQGMATAAGCQLVSSCDLAIASDDVGFCTPGVNIGNFCTTPLVAIGRKMHRKHAMEMALTGDVISAEDAVRFGLINKTVPKEALRAEVQALAEKIASKSAQSISAGKEAFYRQIDMPLEDAYNFAIEGMIEGTMRDDAAEGASAFLGKRKPKWGDV